MEIGEILQTMLDNKDRRIVELEEIADKIEYYKEVNDTLLAEIEELKNTIKSRDKEIKLLKEMHNTLVQENAELKM